MGRFLQDPGTRRRACSVLLAIVCLAVLATRVHVGFERVRLRVVTVPVTATVAQLTIPLADVTPLTGAPVAVVMRLLGAAEPVNLTAVLDGAFLARVTVPPGREIRVDVPAFAPAGVGAELTLAGDRAGWQLAYLEIANVYGFSDGVVSFVIVPRERPHDRAIPPWLLAIVAIGLLMLPAEWSWPPHRIGRRIRLTASGLVLMFFAVVLSADSMTQYKLLISSGTFALCVAILHADSIVWALRGLLSWSGSQARNVLAPRLRPLAPFVPHTAIVVLVLISVGRFYDPETGFTPLIVFGDQFQARAVPALQDVPRTVYEGSGYDGQFYAQLALDPFLRDEATVRALDNPPYRARRMLLSLVAWAAGAGRPEAVVQAYAVLNIVAWLILSVLLLRWLHPGGLRPTLAWAGCVLAHGLLASVRQALPDGPSVLLFALAIIAVERRRVGVAAGILGLAGLARETNLIGASTLPRPAGPAHRQMAVLATSGATVLAPLIAWAAYLRSLGLPSHDAGLRNFALPLAGYLGKWVETVASLQADVGDWYVWFSLLTLVGLTTQAVTLLLHRESQNAWWRLGVAYLGLMILLGPAVWSGHPPAVTRVVLPMTIAFNVVLPRVRRFWPLWALGNASLLHGLDVIRIPWLWE